MGTVLDYEKTLKMPSKDVKIYSDLKNAERAGLNEAFFSADLDPVELYYKKNEQFNKISKARRSEAKRGEAERCSFC